MKKCNKIPSQQGPRDEAVRLRRRRLLLGAAAVPTVYTLMSGAGVAAASLTCWDAQSQAVTPTPVTSAPDQWARGSMISGMTGTGWKVNAYCMNDPGKQSKCTDALQPDWSAAQTYWFAGGQRTLESQGGVRFIPKSPGYGLLYVDRTGTIQVFDKTNYGDTVKYVSGSCWASLHPATKALLG
jgi:hypothetical protein